MELCAKRYDQVVSAAAHNAFTNEDRGWRAPNQTHDITRQLTDGVRGLMLDLHDLDGVPSLCHGDCSWGDRPLTDGLVEIRDFMDANPGAVVTIILESYVTGAAAVAAFEASGLADYAYAHTAGDPWPTLGELTETGARLVVFTDADAGAAPWYHDVWEHCYETHWSWTSAADMNCDVNRGTEAGGLFILNHFLTDPVAMPALAEQVNYNPFLLARAQQCQAERALPNFLTVDFASIGDVMQTVDILNGLAEPTEPSVRPLVDNRSWTLAPNDTDPFFPGNELKATQCSDVDIGVEEQADGPWFDVSTKGCAYMTAQTPLLERLPNGATLQLRIWRFTITIADGPFELKVAVGDPATVVFERTIDAPNTKGELIHQEWVIDRTWQAGAPVYWHLSNHGDNSWGFIEFSATY